MLSSWQALCIFLEVLAQEGMQAELQKTAVCFKQFVVAKHKAQACHTKDFDL